MIINPFLELGDIDILDREFKVPVYYNNKVKIFRLDYELLSTEFVDLFVDISKSKPTNIQLFYTPPRSSNQNIHIDGSSGNGMWAINKVIDGTNIATMNWYSVNPEYVPSVNSSGIDTKYTLYSADNVSKTHEYILIGTVLVKIGIPHNINNCDNIPRWCVSIRPEKYHFSYDEMYNRMLRKNNT